MNRVVIFLIIFVLACTGVKDTQSISIVTPLGTAQVKGVVDPWVAFSNITLLPGEGLIACVAYDDRNGSAEPWFSWNGQNWPLDWISAPGPDVNIEIHYMLGMTTGGSGTVVLNWNEAAHRVVPPAAAVTLYKVNGLKGDPIYNSPIDRYARAWTYDSSGLNVISMGGTGTRPDSFQTEQLSQANELLLGCVGTEGPQSDNAGTWDIGANQTTDLPLRIGTNGRSPTSNITVSSAVKIVNSTTGGRASKSNITSRDWAAAVVGFILEP